MRGKRRPVDTIDLALARPSLLAKSDGLWSVLDAAQYASLILQDPSAGDRGGAIEAFVEAFSALIETWNEAELRNKGPLIAAVLARTDALAEAGVFVHWGVTRRRFVTAAGPGGPLRVRLDADGKDTAAEEADDVLPVAVVWLDLNGAAHLTIDLPETLPMTEGDDPDAA